MITRLFRTPFDLAAEDLRSLRTRVFIEEQQVPESLEWDDDDARATHFLAFHGSEAIATARLLPGGQIGRMAVLAPWRGRGVGRQLLQGVMAEATALGLDTLTLHAQTHALGFYQRAGFVAEGDTFMDAGIPHLAMRRHGPVDAPRPPRLPRLGEDSDWHFIQDEPDAYRLYAALLTEQSRRILRIQSEDLEPELYDQPRFLAAVSTLARDNRHTEVRILLGDSSRVLQNGHRLLELSRRLPSAIQIRRLPDRESNTREDSFLLADQSGVLLRPWQNGNRGYACFYHPGRARELSQRFDERWHRAEADPNLRTLHL